MARARTGVCNSCTPRPIVSMLAWAAGIAATVRDCDGGDDGSILDPRDHVFRDVLGGRVEPPRLRAVV